MSQLPRVRPAGRHGMHVCAGLKDGKYHSVWALSWWEAARRWYETEPTIDMSFF